MGTVAGGVSVKEGYTKRQHNHEQNQKMIE